MAAAKNQQMANFIAKRIDVLRDRKSQKDIAEEAGYANQNMINFLKNGTAKLSFERVVDLAKALEVDPRHLFRLAVAQYISEEALPQLAPFLSAIVSDNELAIIEFIRGQIGDEDLVLNDRMKNTLSRAFKEVQD